MGLSEPGIRRAVSGGGEPRERLIAGDRAGAQIENRLERHSDRVVALQEAEDLLALLRTALEPRQPFGLGRCRSRLGETLKVAVVELPPALTTALGGVHGEVRLAQHLVDARGRSRRR